LRALRMAEEEFRGTGIRLRHHMQTNLLLYETSKWRDIVTGHFGGVVGSSLDYPNPYRRTASLEGEAYNAAWCAKRDMAERDGIRVSVIALPNRGSIGIGAERFYRYYRDEVGVDGLQINLPFPNEEKGFEPMPLEDLGRFLSDLYRYWGDSGREIGLSPFQAFENHMRHQSGCLPCLWAHRCSTSMLCIGPDGMVAQCDCWSTTFREYGFGSVLEEDPAVLLASEARQAFARRPVRLQRDSECGECPYWSICFGGCAVRAFTWTGDFDAPDHYCPVYRDVFSAIADRTESRGFARVHSNDNGGGDA
jgi:radical SAM protein with 4Fe4S-binding SPASM domain